MKQLATLSLEVEHLRLDVTTLRLVLDHIANKPIGDAEASHSEMLGTIVEIARWALSRTAEKASLCESSASREVFPGVGSATSYELPEELKRALNTGSEELPGGKR